MYLKDFFLAVLKIEPRVSGTRGKLSTTELQPPVLKGFGDENGGLRETGKIMWNFISGFYYLLSNELCVILGN